MILFDLFMAFLRVELFAFGGADALLPLIEKEVVERYNWLAPHEFSDMLGAAKIFPGALSIKFATYTGYKIAGIPGIIAANLGNFIMPAALGDCQMLRPIYTPIAPRSSASWAICTASRRRWSSGSRC